LKLKQKKAGDNYLIVTRYHMRQIFYFEAVFILSVNLFFTITRPENGQMPGINEGKRRRKVAVNKGK